MGVYFSFAAFKTPKHEDQVDEIADHTKSFTYYFVNELEEYLSVLEDNYHLNEKDLAFLLQTDGSAYSGIKSPLFFKATDVLSQFNKLKEIMKTAPFKMEGSEDNLYEGHKTEFEEFTAFFEKHAQQDHWVQGVWW